MANTIVDSIIAEKARRSQAIADEREACALIAEANALVHEEAVRLNDGPQEDTYPNEHRAEEARAIAYAIRSRTI